MIIDATTGSIARFVNHSCNPNCRMIKWIVSGQPRMALFAGDKPIMTGDELTYDYNFDPFSAKNVQKCLCGEANCRGVLGPKPRAPAIKNLVSSTVKAGKRKLQEMIGNGAATDDSQPRKKAKALSQAKPITSTKDALASVGMKMSKGTATALRKGISSLASSAKKVALSKQTGVKPRAKTSAVLKKTTTTRVIAYGKKTPVKRTAGKATKTARVLPKAKGKLPAPARRPRIKGLPMARKTPFDLMSLRTETVETEVETEMVVATSPKTTPKRQSGWAAINLPPREDSDVERPEITVAHMR
jgi:[histone H3]-lysine4 N-trimethyltransferase ASH1L